MQKGILILIVVLVIILSLILFMLTSLGIFSLSNSSCAFFGIFKLTELETRQILDGSNYTNVKTLSDEDFKQVPKFLELIHKVSGKIRFNDQSEFGVTNPEMEKYYQSFAEIYKKNEGFELGQKKDFLLIEYNNKRYVVGGFSFPQSRGDLQSEIDLVVTKATDVKALVIILDENDLDKIPKIKNAIKDIGMHEVQSFENIGMTENESNHYRKWFDEKFVEGYSYFRYGDKIYSPSFVIC